MSKCAGCGKSFAHFVCNDPDRCQSCGEVSNNRAVKGAIKCGCDAPKMPYRLRDNARDDRPTPQVRYGN